MALIYVGSDISNSGSSIFVDLTRVEAARVKCSADFVDVHIETTTSQFNYRVSYYRLDDLIPLFGLGGVQMFKDECIDLGSG